MKIPPEAIEAACVARYGEKWDDPDVSERAMRAARNRMAQWLTAALPHIRAAVLEEAAAMFDEVAAAHRAWAERLREGGFINAHHDALAWADERSNDGASIRALKTAQSKETT